MGFYRDIELGVFESVDHNLLIADHVFVYKFGYRLDISLLDVTIINPIKPFGLVFEYWILY